MNASIQAVTKMDWERIFAEIYASVLTEEEIDGLIEFYKSPAGRAFIKKQPELTKATMEALQLEMMKIMPEIEKTLAEAIEE